MFSVIIDILGTVLQLGGSFLWKTIFIWLPPLLVYIFVKVWLAYVRAKFLAEQEYTMLEVRVPKEVLKSPLAMELVLNYLYQPFGEAQWYEKYIKGGLRPWTSLELVSIEGQVKFFIWIGKGSAPGLMNQIYGQYPEIEIHEVEDYVPRVDYESGDYTLWGCEFKLTKPDPYPIKTYVDYGLEKDPKEEFKIDPMTPMLEFLGSLGKGEHAWFQFLVRAHKDDQRPMWSLFKTTDTWKDTAKEEMKKIIKEGLIKKDDAEEISGTQLSEGQKQAISSLERSIAKLPLDTGIRGMYIAENDVFSPSNIGGIAGAMKQYSWGDLNGFKLTNTTAVKYPWSDPFGKKVPMKKWMMYDAYRKRSYFHPPYKSAAFVLNTEELATLYHFPGGVAQTPTFKRIESKKVEPPSNLPI